MGILVGKQAPDFTAPAVFGNGSIVDDFKLSDFLGEYVVLFFWPMDFSFVCPTEVIAHNSRVAKFRERNVSVIGVSVDSQYTHYAWRRTPVDKGGIGSVDFPMVSDVSHEIVRAYGIECESSVALRASFLIDQKGIVQHQVVNNLALGRNVDEMLRMVDALQYTERNKGVVCPAGWRPGADALDSSEAGISEYLLKHAEDL